MSPGVVLDNVAIDTVNRCGYHLNLAAIGTSAGFGNPSNAILANYFVDTFEITLTEPNHTMVMLNLLTLVGGPLVNVSFYDKNDVLIGKVSDLDAPPDGKKVLFWAEDRQESIGRITIFAPDNGAEGIMQSEYWVPEPATLSLLALGVAFVLKRRR